uniref:DNA-directed DNA polymerase n=1 Tax=Panagrolaimus sp. ES5 TaxID=591445 RepID=A0AC34FHV5_9BILA
MIKHASGGIAANLDSISVYPYCMQSISTFLGDSPKCVIPYQYKIIDKIINTCSDAAFTKLNLTFLPSKSPISTYIDDLENLGANKIGLILDSYTEKKLPFKIIEIFGNLTYEEFDALKMIATTDSHLKQILCDSKENSQISKKFESIKNRIALSESPQIPEKIKNIFKIFSVEILEAVKTMLKVHPHFRWSFCSQILAISPSEELTNIYSPAVTKWAIRNCQIMARNHSIYHSAICD